MIRKSSVILLTAILAVGCSVFEDRTPCPGVMTVDIGDIRSKMGSGLLRFDLLSAEGTKSVSRLVAVEKADTLQFVLPKAGYIVCAAAGQENTQFTSDGKIYGASGIEADTVFAFSDRVTVSGELTEYDAKFHKNFATVKVINAFASDPEDPFAGMTLTVRSRYGGLDYRRMEASANEFVCRVKADAGYIFRMPRQGDESMILSIETPMIIHNVPVGKYLKDMGYDFGAQDMEDVTVGVDLVAMTVRITIEDWRREEVYAII